MTQGATRISEEKQDAQPAVEARPTIEQSKASSILRVPPEPSQPDNAWIDRARRFYRLGIQISSRDEGLDPSGFSWEGSVPAAVTPLRKLKPGLPAVLIPCEDDAPPAVRPLPEVLEGAIESIRSSGHPARLLGDLVDRLVRRIARRTKDNSALLHLREVAGEEATALIKDLELVGEARDSLSEDVERLLASLSLGWRLVGPGVAADLIAVEVLRQSREPARRRLLREAATLAEKVEDLLRLDAGKGDSPELPRDLQSGLGHVGSRHVDAEALARVHPDRKANRFDPARRKRLHKTASVLRDWIEKNRDGPLPAHLVTGPEKATAFDSQQMEALDLHRHSRPLEEATELYLEIARPVVEFARALRIARLEATATYRAAIHDDAIESLDWQAIKPDELAVVPPVIVLLGGLGLDSTDIGDLSHLVWSGRPVLVLATGVTPDDEEIGDLSRHQPTLGALLIALRYGWVLQSSIARPTHLTGGLLASDPCRPGLVLLASAPGPSWAEAAASGRAWPLIRFRPTGHESGESGMDLDDNISLESDWPKFSLEVEYPKSPGTLEVSLTFADAAMANATGREHVLPIPPECWSESQTPLAEWLRHPERDSATGPIPFIWLADGEGVLWRAVVSRALALASLDRLRAFEHLKDLAGVGGPNTLRVRTQARDEAMAEAVAEKERLEKERDDAVAQALEAGARNAMSGLAAALISSDGVLPLVGRAATLSASQAKPSEDAPAEEEEPAGEKEAPEEPEIILDEPWVDTPLCTSCNDCFKINELLFKYDENKQAYLNDLSKATYAELVKAAEICPAKCIHPGRPDPDDPTATPEMIQRGKPL